jgi:RecB family exonuclease
LTPRPLAVVVPARDDRGVGRRRAQGDTDASGDVRVVTGVAAGARRAAALAWLRRYPADHEVVLVGPTLEACDDLARELTLQTGALFGVTRLTFGRLAGQLAAPALAATDSLPANGLTLDAVAARALQHVAAAGGLGYFTPVAARPGLPRAAAATVQELRLEHVLPAALAAVEPAGPALAALATRLESEMTAAGVADRATVVAAATAAATAGEGAGVGLPLLLLDVPIASEAEAGLLRALAARAPAVLATVPAGDARSLAFLEAALGVAAETLTATAPGSLGTLQTHLFADVTPPRQTVDATVSLHSWPGEARECVEIARRIRDEAAAGTPFDRMAVFVHAAADYRAHLEEALRRADIPVFFARGTTRPDPSGRALLALLACREEGLSARRFAEYLSLAQVPTPGEQQTRAADVDVLWVPPEDDLLPPTTAPAPPSDADAALPVDDPEAEPVVGGTLHAPWRWERHLVEASVIGGQDAIGGKERWARRLAGLEHELRLQRAAIAVEDEARAERADRELADLGHLTAFALPLIEQLAALPARAPWGEWLHHLQRLAAVTLRTPEHVLATLAELAPMASVGPVELVEVQQVLAGRLRELTVPPPRRRYGAVLVAPAERARGMAFDVVFVPGLAERLFPRKIVEDPILLDAARERLSAAADRGRGGRRTSGRVRPLELATQATRVAHERLALRLAVGAATRTVVLSYPRLDIEQARPRVPSFYTLEALSAAEGHLPGFDEIAARARGRHDVRIGWPAPAAPTAAIDDAEYDLAVLRPLLDAETEAPVGAAHYLLGTNPHLARALRARARRWFPKWNVADGLVDPDDLARAALARHQLAARSYSPTALQNFAACPYRFFLQAVLRLKPREEPVAIEMLDPLTRGALFHDVQFRVLTALRERGTLPVRPDTLDAALAVVDTALRAVADGYRDQLAPAIERVWDDGIDGIRADLREWLRREAESDGRWAPHRFELSFGLPLGERAYADPASVPEAVPVIGDLTLRGSIDLVERHADGRVRATDHKTGKVRARTDVVVGGGEILQPVLYALACERLLDEPVESGRLYYCAASGGFEERVVPLDATSRAAAAEVAAIVGRALADGFLPAAPAPRACFYCDYRTVCGPYEELRVKRKPAARLADLTRLRAMP